MHKKNQKQWHDFVRTEFTAYLWKEAREYLFEDSLGALSSGRDKELKKRRETNEEFRCKSL